MKGYAEDSVPRNERNEKYDAKSRQLNFHLRQFCVNAVAHIHSS